MVKVTIRLDKRYKNALGEYAVKLTFAREGKTLYIPVGISLKEADWDNVKKRVLNVPNRSSLTMLLKERLLRAEEKLVKLQSEGKLRMMSDKEVIEYLSDAPSNLSTIFFSYQADRFISTLTNSNTKRFYHDTIRHVREFVDDYDSLTMNDITVSWLKEYDAFFADRLSVNTRSIDYRNIRKIFNHALDNEDTDNYPFRRFKIKNEETRKRSLTISQLRSLLHYQGTATEKKYIDLFFLSFYLMGINMVDLSRLSSIENGRIHYRRAKTGTLYDIKVEPEAMAVINKYRGKERLLSYFESNKDYTSVVKKAEKRLKEIAKKIGFDESTAKSISMYWARHSFATVAANLDIPIDTISECLGHKHGSRITAVYVNFDKAKVDAANRKVIDFLHENV